MKILCGGLVKGLLWTSLVCLFLTAAAPAAMKRTTDDDLRRMALRKVMATPNTQNCSHRVGNVFFTITNWGFFGSQFGDATDWLRENYCLGPGVIAGESAPSFEFPAGTGISYLFQGALWIGAIVDEDTLVSFGADGWQRTNEMYPRAAPFDNIVQLSSRRTSEFYSPEAVSEQDYFAEYTDTLVDDALTGRDFLDNRSHKPLGIKILQRSYAWSFSYAEDFVLIDYKIVNIGDRDLRKMYMALYVDADIWNLSVNPLVSNGFDDDITGYLANIQSPTCNQLTENIDIAWIADFDGDPEGGVFNQYSPTGVAGTRVVRSPNPELNYSFNWWVSNGDDTNLDWGPRLQANNRDFGGFLGTPEGDRNKYYIMSQPEFDYDQIYSAVDHTAQGWLPPNATFATDLADGFDTRYLFSFGPFELSPGDTLPITIGYVAGDKFHRTPNDFRLFSPSAPQAYYDALDFSDLVTNALWAGWVYDNPGIDTDGDGVKSTDLNDPYVNPCTGREYYKSGDGKPDFAGPPPPQAPLLRFSASPGKVTLRWNGKISETTEDPFSSLLDFEGYRVYMGSRLVLSEFALLTSYDFEDFNRYRQNRNFDPPRWELTEVPFTLDSLRAIYGPEFDPARYPNAADSLEVPEENAAYYFTPQDYNREVLGEPGGIAKRFPNAQKGDMIWEPELNDSVDAYYEYEYVIDGLLPSRPVYFAVSTIDFGNPATSLAALESSPLANAIEVYPVNSNDRVESEKLEVTVFPNPYRIDGGYLEAGYEQLTTAAPSPERARRLHFANLPSAATIRIYTLDGDMVREMQHPCDCPLQE
ncbi:MAG: hypothetical protein IT585_03730, partial [candidate division Zixibacteria bacterium]|nr:hypothetical protein [candidate division Zixibacteria bacterium]